MDNASSPSSGDQSKSGDGRPNEPGPDGVPVIRPDTSGDHTDHRLRTSPNKRRRTGVRAAVIGIVVLGLTIAGYAEYNRRQRAEAEKQDIYNAGVQLLADGFRADIVSIDNARGEASFILGKGVVECYIDGVRFNLTRGNDEQIVDAGNYTLRVTTNGMGNDVVIQNADQLGAVLGPNPCTPGPNGPRANGLR